MNKMLNNVMIFAVGAAIGSAVTWKLVKTRYEQIAQEEIDSVKEVFSRKNLNEKPAVEESEDEEPDDKAGYKKFVEETGYAAESEKEEERDMSKPYVISPDEFGECDYATISLTYFADGVVANERNRMIKNVDELIGLDSLNHFGEYEEDSVFVRNDDMMIDYEILRDYRNFSEVS